MSNSVVYDATQHAVHSVTVFQVNRADVNRRIQLDLKKGQNEVEIKNLPSILEQDSIRVDGIGKAVIFDVIYKPPPVIQVARGDDAPDNVKQLYKNKDSIENELRIYTKQSSIMEDYSHSLNGEHTSAEQLTAFLEVYGAQERSISTEQSKLRESIQIMEKSIAEAEKLLAKDVESMKRGVRIVVIVLAEEDGPAELSLSYAVNNASWTPLYDLRADIGSEDSKVSFNGSKISLQYKASIFQSTAENWTDVHLTLSTASPQVGSLIPTLKAHRLVEEVAYAPFPKPAKAGGAPGWVRPESWTTDASAPVTRTSIRNRGVVLETQKEETAPRFFGRTQARATDHSQGFSSTFAIEGLSSIPSDTDQASEKHKVTIAVVELDKVELEWVAVPKEIPSVFLKCKVKNTSEYTFLPGDANIFMNNNFVSKSRISNVSPHESFTCSLGVDPSLRITYYPLTKKIHTPSGSLLSTKTITTSHSQRIILKNTRRQPITRLIVRDIIPISNDVRIKITVHEPPSLPEIGTAGAGREVGVSGAHSKDVKARWAPVSEEEEEKSGEPNEEGIVEWICRIEAGASMDLSLNWEVNVPKGLKWKAF